MLKDDIYVVMFHGVCPEVPKHNRWHGSRECMMPTTQFDRFMAWATANFEIVGSKKFHDLMVSERVDHPTLLITFDDGMKSTFDHAAPILKKHGASALVFVTVDWIDSETTPPIFALERLAWEMDSCAIKVRLPQSDFTVDYSRRTAHRSIQKIWTHLFAEQVPPFTLEADRILVNDRSLDSWQVEANRDNWFPSTWGSIEKSVTDGVVEIGSHLMSHVPLSWLSHEDQSYQLQKSKDFLEARFGAPVMACAFPHGYSDPESRELASRIYQYSFSVTDGTCLGADRSNLPRFHVSPLRPWEPGLKMKYGKLGSVAAKVGAKFARAMY